MSWNEHSPRSAERVNVPAFEEFSYDLEAGRFELVSRTVRSPVHYQNVGDIWRLRAAPNDYKSEEVPWDGSGAPLVILRGLGTLVMLPSLRRWLRDANKERIDYVLAKAREAMTDVFYTLQLWEGVSIARQDIAVCVHAHHDRGARHAFDLEAPTAAYLLPNPHAQFVTYPTPGTAFEDDSLPVELALDNAELVSQRLALFAGAGTIAHFAREDLVKAGELERV